MFGVTILGNNSALPMHDRHPTSQVVTYDEHLFLVDCGEGAQIQMNRYKIRRSRIHHIFISHLHGDHYFGLAGLLNSFGLNSRQDPVHLYAPAPLRDILELQFRAASTVLPYELLFHPLEQPGLIAQEKKIEVFAFPVSHRIPCWGFLFREREKPRKLDAEQLKAYRIPSYFYPRLKQGEDYRTASGEVILNEQLTQPASRCLSYAYTADTIFDPSICPYVEGCDVLYHESTYLDAERERAAARFHSTSLQAALIAQQAGARRLLLGHFSSKYEDLHPFEEEAKTVFPQTEIAWEGSTFIIGA